MRAEQSNVSTQTMGSSFLDRTHPLKNSRFESELTTLAELMILCYILKLESNKFVNASQLFT